MACLCDRLGRWRDACSKLRSDDVQDGASCGAKQRQGHAVSPIAEQEATIHLHPLSGVPRSASTGTDQAAYPATQPYSL
jgi:hypothetical protein